MKGPLSVLALLLMGVSSSAEGKLKPLLYKGHQGPWRAAGSLCEARNAPDGLDPLGPESKGAPADTHAHSTEQPDQGEQ